MTLKQNGKSIAIIGAVLQLGIVISIVVTTWAMCGASAEAEASANNGAINIEALAKYISQALWGTAIGTTLSLSGAILLLVALIKIKFRAAWFHRSMWFFAMLWLLNIPIGTLLAIFAMIYLSKHKQEFMTQPQQQPNLPATLRTPNAK